MTTFVLSFLVVALAVTGMALGVLAGRDGIRGSCGGAGGCGTCQRPCRRRQPHRSEGRRPGEDATPCLNR